MTRPLAIILALALSAIAYEIHVAVLRWRLPPACVCPDAVPVRRDPLDGLVPRMRHGMPRPVETDAWPIR